MLSQKRLCKSIFLIRCFIKTDKMKCLRSVSDSNIQIYGFKSVCMLLGYLFGVFIWSVCMLLWYLFCFKVTDQIKYSINESLITLDIRPWILILKSNVSLEYIKCFRITYYGSVVVW